MNRIPADMRISKKSARLSIGAFFFMAGLRFASRASRIPDIKLHLELSDAGLGCLQQAIRHLIAVLGFTTTIMSPKTIFN